MAKFVVIALVITFVTGFGVAPASAQPLITASSASGFAGIVPTV